MRIVSPAFLAAFAMALLSQADPASACSCQKEYMIEKYGKITAIGQEQPPVPPRKPAPPEEKGG